MKNLIRLVGVFIFIFILLKIDIKQTIKIFTNVKIEYIILSSLLFIPHLFVKSIRWNLLLRQQKIKYSFFDTFIIYLSSLYVGFITPGRLGELIKVFYLKNDKNINYGVGLASVMLDRIFDLYLLLLLSIICLIRFNIFENFSNAFLIVIVFLSCLPLLIFKKKVIYHFLQRVKLKFVRKIINRKVPFRIKNFISEFVFLLNFRLFTSILLTFLGYFFFFLQCKLIAISINLDIGFINLSLFNSLSNIISFLPISFSGIGTREAVLVYLFGLVNMDAESAVLFSLLVFFTLFGFGGIIGFFSWLYRPIDLKSIKFLNLNDSNKSNGG